MDLSLKTVQVRTVYRTIESTLPTYLPTLPYIKLPNYTIVRTDSNALYCIALHCIALHCLPAHHSLLVSLPMEGVETGK